VSTPVQTDPHSPQPSSSKASSSNAATAGLLTADKVAAQVTTATAANGVHYAAWGETRVAHHELERLVAAVPAILASAISRRCYYFVPLVIADGEGAVASPTYTVDLGDQAICHRNVSLGAPVGSVEGVFLSTRLVEDRFGLAFEFFINVAHNFVDAAGVPESFANLAWSQAQAAVRGETSQDAWETRRRAIDPNDPNDPNGSGDPATPIQSNESVGPVESVEPVAPPAPKPIDERARKNYEESAFSDALAIYMLSLSLDFDYHDLREREYPLLAAPALAERLRHVAALFPANNGYEFQILYRRKG
jgi:hypothetical protein